jgi:hypothetical protein
MSDMTDDMTREQAEAVRDSLDDLWTVIDHYDERQDEPYDTWDEHVTNCETCATYVREYGEDAEPRDTLHERPLEIVWEKGEPFAVVLGIGGPHTEVTGGGRASGTGYVLTCYWGGDVSTVRGEGVTRTGDYFRELVQETDQ